MMDNKDQTVYWLWLQRTLGCGAQIARVLRDFESPQAIWAGDEAVYRACDAFGKLRAFSEKGLPQLLDKSLDDCIETMELCRKKHITILTPDDPRYPDRLRNLQDLPAALYIRGDAECLNGQYRFAVIGAREPTRYAFEAATEIAEVLSENGAVVISGGAIGIDAAAHEAALRKGQKTLLVMGCGHGSTYLPTNADLRRRVASCGALVTEYPPLTQPGRGSFQLRNRLISGLSDAVVIIQAGEKSGTLNTANHAKQQGRDIFVLPGSRNSVSFAGSNRLLVEGAKTVLNGEDIFASYGVSVASHETLAENGEPFEALLAQEQELPAPKKGSAKQKSANPKTEKQHRAAEKEPQREKISNFDPKSVSKNAQIVYNILQKQPAPLDSLVRESGLPVPLVLGSLTELELCGAVARDASAVYTVQ